MALSWTLAQLKSAIQAWAEDDGTELSDELENLIQLGEERIYREADPDVFRKYSSGEALTSSQATYTFPSDLVIERDVAILDGSGNRVPLIRKDRSFVVEYNNSKSTGTPRFYCEYDSTQWEIAPIPDSNSTIEIAYIYRPNSLVTDTSGTWLSQNAADLLFYASFLETLKFLKLDPQELAPWEADYQRALQSFNMEQMARQRHDEVRTGEPRGTS